jgi:hypothetical protein
MPIRRSGARSLSLVRARLVLSGISSLTCQNVFAGNASMPATPCYFAWGCFRYFSREREPRRKLRLQCTHFPDRVQCAGACVQELCKTVCLEREPKPAILLVIGTPAVTDSRRGYRRSPLPGRAQMPIRLPQMLVPLAGIEPALLAELDFESSASTSSATGAHRAPVVRPGSRSRRNIAGGLGGSTRACRIALRGGCGRSRASCPGATGSGC